MQAHSPPPPKKRKYRVLYLGSDLELIFPLRKALAEADCRLVACSDRETAVLFLNSEIPYQLLVIDWQWRGREGLELARLVQALKHRADMSVIMVSANELNRELKTAARKVGIRHCLSKRQDLAELVHAIGKAVNRE
jgi:DNA-binding response OmpR family regulator